jgi:hypothetical protein
MRVHRGRTMTGPAGTAVEVIIDEVAVPDHAATLATWFLHCPGQSPAWDKYLLSAVHLRPIEGVRPAAVNLPGATHEVLLLALVPDAGPTPDDPSTWVPMQPFNLMEQVVMPDDESTVVMLEMAVQAVLDGVLWAEPPLSGQVEPWLTALVKTSAHARGEAHAP